MGSMTVCYRTVSDRHVRTRRRDRLPLPSIPLVLLMLGLLSISACSKEREQSTPDQTENEAGGTADAPKRSGNWFSSELRLHVFIIREAGGEREFIGNMPLDAPLHIPQCDSWGVYVRQRVDMKALAREIAAKKIPLLRIGGVVDGDLAHLKGMTGLQGLDLGSRKITDAGLVHLKSLTGLRMLNLSQTKVSDAGLADLRKALPKTNIY